MVFYIFLFLYASWMVACNTDVKHFHVDSTQNNDFYATNFKCPNGWQQRCEKCYLYVNEFKQWTDAQYHCKQIGGHLVTIKEDAVNLFLSRYVQYSSKFAISIWTGLNARKAHKDFQWVDGSESLHYEFRWLPGQPNMVTLDESCVEMYARSKQYLWDDVSCSKESPFVCQTDGCRIDTQRCDNGKCISKHLFCNSKNDCGDFSDEKNCAKCNEHYNAQEGNISSPNFPQNYGNNRDCTWSIEVESSYIIEISFLEFYVENSFDWVEVFDGPTLASNSFGRFSGNFKPEVILSTSSKILVHLKSDKSTSDKGFFARFKAVKKGCNLDLIIKSDKPEYISSPNFPLNYPDNIKCVWKIRNEDPSQILTFQLLELETEENDFVEVRDGLTEYNRLLGKFFGNFINIQKKHVFTSISEMHIKFQSNFQINQKGFRAVIYSGCTATLNATHGTILSPNFGVANYPNNLRCSWIVDTQTDKEVSLIFHSFDTEYKQDTVVLNTCNNVFIKEFYGSNKTTLSKEMVPSGPIVFKSSCFKVIFKTDETYSLEGFNATFSIGCPMLPAINGGYFRQDQKFYGASVEYKCQSTFRLKNGNFRKCMIGGNWSEPTPFCEEINCGHPGTIENGGFDIYPLNSTFVFMTSVKYSCDAGYTLVGEPNRVCQADSTWSGGVERKCDVLKCSDPGLPVNGIRSGNVLNVGSSISFSCKKGFKIYGAKTITCGITGRWSSEKPLCKVVVCPLPTFPINSVIKSSSTDFKTPYATILHISCEKGFELIGSDNITCTESGVWKPEVPRCIDINECSNNPCRGPGSQCTNLMGSYKCTCKSGFRQTDEVTCEDIDECKSSGRAATCNQICTNLDGGYFCSCEEGYFLYDGDNKTVDRIEAEESFVNHTCLGNPCKLPKIPEKGYIINYGNRYPTVITFQCDKGWIVNGDLSIQCLKNGSWSGPMSDCIAAICNPLPDVPNSSRHIEGELVKGQYLQGAVYTYTCINGYTIKSGNLKRMCSRSATATFWSGLAPICERVSCGPLENPKNGQVKINGDMLGDSSKYVCDGGYVITGNDSRTCEANGRWSGSAPLCLASPCPDPGIPINGERIGIISLDQTIEFRCVIDGYTLVGDKKRTCLFDKLSGSNQWSGSQPFCKDTRIPTFKNCPTSVIEFILPRSEKSMMVNWTSPTVSDNSHNIISITASPNYVSPVIMSAGLNIITYTARDKGGNIAVCEVKINVKDKEIPKIFCPKNIVIGSDLATKVFWSDGIYTDNVDIKRVTFSPPNGTVLDSNKYHRVTMTVEDSSDNSDTCVMEIYVKGCGCTQRDCDYKQRNGVSNCTIAIGTLVPDKIIISCNLECLKNSTTTLVSNIDQGEKLKTVNCLPNKGWENPLPSGCVENKPLISCLKGSLLINFTTTGNSTDEKPFLDIFTFFNNLKNSSQLCSFIHQTGSLISDGASVVGDFKILPHVDAHIPLLNQHLEECKTILNEDLKLYKSALLLKTSAVDIQILYINNCCPSNKALCCPTGHLLRTTGGTVKSSYCIPCGLGYYHNSTNNKCLNCPVGFYNDLEFADKCKSCPIGTSNLKSQSDSCTKMCAAGTFSSTGLEPTCRKCDYGEYQSQVGAYSCMKCPDSLTTSRRGSENISECKAQCSLGTYSSTGLEPCTNCNKGLFQNEIGRSYCKLCPSGGIYLGKEGATSESDCPTNNACDEMPCKNGAICNAGNYSYTCACKPGWSGVNCEVDIDECASSPCGTFGTCINLVNDFNCTCVVGITGKQCETNIDDCENDTCSNSGVCSDLVNDFKCVCAAGFEGYRCEINKNECEPNPCLQNSTCEDLINDFKCNCTPGYMGKLCNIDIDECAVSPCFNNATCFDKVNAFECKCLPGFNGTLCETDIDECSIQPCANNGSCIDVVNGFLCRCKDGFRGSNCSINIDECDPSPCLHNSTCVDEINGFQCKCRSGYFGLRCETEINECESQPCLNNATCVDKINDYQCLCNIGFEGKQCEIDTNECQPNPCDKGLCKDLIGHYLCECQPGFDGRNCSNLIDNCFSSPCRNNGSCTNKVNSYTCKCQPGYTGSDCETNINECDPDPCNGHALNCTDLINDYICYCKLGFRGENCSEIVDNCNPQPCRHNSTCINHFETNNFQCNCSLGYEGDRCDVEIDECKPLPCKQGNCTNLIGKYYCTCPAGFTGVDCEINIDDCKNVSCLNGGKCIDLIKNYVCECPATHKGEHCEKKIPDDVDITLPGGEGSYIKHCVKGNASKEFSISLWFRFLGRSRGVFLNLGFGCKTIRPFLIMSHSSMRFQFRDRFNFVMINDLRINNEKLIINNGVWHHVYVSVSSISSKLKVVLDGIIAHDEEKPELSGMTFFNESGTILIGKSLYENKLVDSGFVGDVSQVALFRRALDSTEIAGLVRNCSRNISESIIPWVGLMADAGPNVSLLEDWSCGTNVCPPEFTGKFCQTKIDKVPPTVEFCPSSMKVYSENSSVIVYWEEPKFNDNVAVVEVVRSHSPNSLLSWGDYVVTYIAKDSFENSVSCTFEINVSPFNCSTFQSARNSIEGCGNWKWGRFCDYKCLPEYELAVLKPPFYACGRSGTWSHGPPTYPENPDLLVSECTATTPSIAITTNTISFLTTTNYVCDDSFKKDFIESFKQLITELQDVWEICGAMCDFKNIRVSCKSDTKRFRRDITGPKFILDISFDATNETNLAKIQNGIKTKEFNITLMVNNVSISSDQLNVEVRAECSNGSVLKNGACVECPAGTFKNVTNETCEKCPIGSYSNDSGLDMCIYCPNNTTTTSEGSTDVKSCKALCLFGAYLENNDCKDCQIGFYKETAGFEKCKPCPLGSSTKRPGARNQSLCTDVCKLGEELINNRCQPCRIGYYRSNNSQPICVSCPYKQSTYQLGANTSLCLAVCEIGKEISENGMKCMECAIGYYKNDTNIKNCSKCPTGLTTKQLASTSIIHCIEKINSSELKQYDIQVAFTSLTWSDELYNKNTVEYRDAAYKIIESVYAVYSNTSSLLFVNISDLSPGSVVANLTLGFKLSVNDPLFVLNSAVKSQQFYKLTVDQDSLIADRCEHVVCPMQQVCSYDVEVECKCTGGKKKSPDGVTCHDTCEFKGCPEGQECISNATFNECRCKDGKVLSVDKKTCINTCEFKECPEGQECVSNATFNECRCKYGKVLSADKKTCIDTCEFKGCPEGQECVSNATFNECRCKDGKVLSADKRTCISHCILDYCKNGGSCHLKETGPVCRCSKDFSGNQCQIPPTKSNTLMIVLVSLSVIAVILIVLYVLKNRKKRIYNEQKNDLMYDDEKSLELAVKSMDKKPVILTRYDNYRSSDELGRLNNGATFDESSPTPLIKKTELKR